jgi:hypothetical protein
LNRPPVAELLLPQAADHAAVDPLDVQVATVGPPCYTSTGLRLRLNPVAPSPKQAAFLALTNREALFGGAGGGGKSIAMLMAALQFVDVPGYNALILRRTLKSLKLPNGLIDWSHRWLGDVPGASWNGNDYRWTFDTGPGQDPATLTFGYLSHSGSEDKYRSSELHFIGFDELTEFPWEDQYQFMFSRLRKAKNLHGAATDGTTLADVPLRVRAATNPGGPGMPWVKRRFVAAETAKRPFLASLLSDNPGIDADEYRASLAELSEVERKRMEEGDWDAVEVAGALWRFADFVWTDRIEPRPAAEVNVRAIGVDPSVSADTGKGDECGIVIGSITSGTVTAELDLSGKMHPDDWARTIVTAYHAYGCSAVIVEDNQGKALLHTALRGAADQLDMALPRLFVIAAKDSKEARALPVAQAYRATPKRVIHDLTLKGGSLEAQLCSWVPRKGDSPDRLDALVWLVRHLLYGDGKAVQYRAAPSNPAAARSSVASMMSGRMPGT